MKDSRRLRQVNRLILQELGTLLLYEFEDDMIRQCVTVTGVETTADLRYAKVFVSVRGSEPHDQMALDILRSSSKHLRYLLGQRIRLKYLPELDFRVDRTQEAADRIESVLKEVLPPDENESGNGQD